jgi:hypothetical protein
MKEQRSLNGRWPHITNANVMEGSTLNTGCVNDHPTQKDLEFWKHSTRAHLPACIYTAGMCSIHLPSRWEVPVKLHGVIITTELCFNNKTSNVSDKDCMSYVLLRCLKLGNNWVKPLHFIYMYLIHVNLWWAIFFNTMIYVNTD